MASTFKSNLGTMDIDYSGPVVQAYNDAKQQLTQVRTANLEGPDRALPDDLNQKLDSTNAEFVAGKANLYSQLAPQREELNKKHMTFQAIKWGLIVLGILVALVKAISVLGVIMVIAGIVCHFVFKNIDEKASYELSSRWRSYFAHYQDVFGHKETLHEMASGLYKEVDDLYLKSLDDQARGFEMQRRQMQKQMDAQNEQHQQSMAMQAAQMEAMQKMINEQRAGNIISLMKK